MGFESFLPGMEIASVLMTQLLEEAKYMGKHAVIECVPEQKCAIRIAEKFGFHNTGIDEGRLMARYSFHWLERNEDFL